MTVTFHLFIFIQRLLLRRLLSYFYHIMAGWWFGLTVKSMVVVDMISSPWTLPGKFAEHYRSFLGFSSKWATRCFEVLQCYPEFGRSIFWRIALWIADPLHSDKDMSVWLLQSDTSLWLRTASAKIKGEPAKNRAKLAQLEQIFSG